MLDLISLIKEFLENEFVKDVDITVKISNIEEINELARFCGEHGHRFEVYETWEKGELKRLVRIRV